ncbi:MAG: CHRD domain-containing protein [Deltaproteobacteria bacterium]|nr:CHRD domain-containing protein [Deltaproteobacteria bacterium]
MISTTGEGKFKAKISNDGSSIDYELSFTGLAANIIAAHIHLAQPDVNGGIVIWLCSNLPSPPTPAGTQACPTAATAGTVTETITSTDVQAVSAQGIAAGDLLAVLEAMSTGKTYVNIHSTTFTNGEICGTIR